MDKPEDSSSSQGIPLERRAFSAPDSAAAAASQENADPPAEQPVRAAQVLPPIKAELPAEQAQQSFLPRDARGEASRLAQPANQHFPHFSAAKPEFAPQAVEQSGPQPLKPTSPGAATSSPALQQGYPYQQSRQPAQLTQPAQPTLPTQQIQPIQPIQPPQSAPQSASVAPIPSAASVTATQAPSLPAQSAQPAQPIQAASPHPVQSVSPSLPSPIRPQTGANGFKLPSISKGYPLPGFSDDPHFANRSQLPQLTEAEINSQKLQSIVHPTQQPYMQLPHVQSYSQPQQPQHQHQHQSRQDSQPPHQHPPEKLPQVAAYQASQTQQQQMSPSTQSQPPISSQGQPQTQVPPPPHTPQQMVMGYMPMYPYGHQYQQPQPHMQYLPQQHPQLQPQPAPLQSDYRPLNVKDALSYLEQVKLHFQTQPDVYNHFLDIMKDFKSHNIDTPGVIDRVSSLFRGHANLIQGFNTFLPAGYSIQCSMDPNDPNPVRVMTPMGSQTLPHMLTQRQQHAQLSPHPAQSQSASQTPLSHQPLSVQQQVQHAQLVHTQRQQTHANAHLHVAQQQQMPQGYSPLQQTQQQPLVSQQASPNSEQRQGPVEFGHAISYVNKIKNHFSNQPEIYKQFLEILQTYQREQLRISEVYSQVRQLFKEAPDLLEGFKNFLPDTSGGEDVAGEVRLPPVGSFGPAQAAILSGQATGHQAARLVGMSSSSMSHDINDGKDYGGSVANGEADLSHQAPVSSIRKPREAEGFIAPPKPIGSSSRLALTEEIAFFDKVKKQLPKSAYHEFLKTLNLFTQQIIDVPALVDEVDPYLSQHPELMQWFKSFVGYEGHPLHIENITQRKHLVDLSQCRSYGRSYRLLPKTERYMPCSGRDELGYEVFNDEWVGHPTWASEDSGFVAHRKNQYEEIMFRVEEERHEYDHYIGANHRTIQVLEAIANRMANMSASELAAFKLPEGLGHGTKIYQKIIRKIYDKKNSEEVINAIHENPGAAVPVILRRLKQKDEEWRRAHREWNKVWREAERKAFYKSLDHLGLTFKQADRKQLTSRALMAEIMAVKAEQTAKRRLATTNLPPLPIPKAQLEFVVDDYSVIGDLKSLIVKYIDFRPTMSAHDKGLCKRFLGVFIDEFFAESVITSKNLSQAFNRSAESSDDNSEDTSSDPVQGGGVNGVSSSANGHILPSPAQADEDTSMLDHTEETVSSQGSWLKLERATPPLREAPTSRSQFNLFGSTSVYLFMRIFEILYSRLAEVKACEEAVSGTLRESRRTPFAVELGLYDNKLENMGLQFDPNDVYGQTLALCHRLLEDDVEAQWFEEALRQAYRNRAYKLYTIDKALQSLVKQLHAIVIDESTVNALLAWESDRARPETDVKSQIELRMQAKQALSGIYSAPGLSAYSYGAAESSEPLFRISWAPSTHHLTFQSLGPFDFTLKGAMDDQQRWEYYVTSYMMSLPTEGVPLDQIRAPVLQRVIPEEGHGYKFEVLAEDLQARIAYNSYKLFFEPGTSDYLLNIGRQGNGDHAKAVRSNRWKQTLGVAEEALREAEAEAHRAKHDLEQNEIFEMKDVALEEADAAETSNEKREAQPSTHAPEPPAIAARDLDAEKAMDVDEAKLLSSLLTPAMLACQPRLELQPVSLVLPKSA